MEKFDVAIIGAGPAGLEAAKILAENNKSVVVLEKNSIIGKKVCAGGLTTKDFALGISPDIADLKFKEVILRTPWSSCRIKSTKPYVATITRENFGKYLVREDRLKGVKIYTNTKVLNIDDKVLKTEKGDIKFDYLIGADGSVSTVRRFLGVDKKLVMVAFHYKVPKKYENMELIFNAELFGAGYAWIFPHKDFTSIGAGFHPEFSKDSLVCIDNFKKWAASREIKLDDHDYESWTINYDYRGHQFNNIFLAGDAAGFASGLTGEGIYFAMISGMEIAKKIIDPNYKTPELKKS